MLISHRHRFIFIKTVKTAGTSVEAFLEPLCTPPGHVVQHHTPTLISAEGVVARRGPEGIGPDHGFSNHMDAAAIRERCAEFDDYRRFTVVRDPYDRTVSWFHFRAQQTDGAVGLSLAQAQELLAEGRQRALQQAFLRFVQEEGPPLEEHRLCIDGELAVQRWLRFESLVPDLQSLIADWQLPIRASAVATALPRFKVIRQGLVTPPPLAVYLSQEAVAQINGQCRWDFATFGYTPHTPEALPSLASRTGKS